MDTTKKLLGHRIKELRKIKSFTQYQLAEIIGVDSKHLSRIEVGSSYPSLDTLEKVSQALDVELKELFVFSHLQDKNELITQINKILENTDENNVRLAYRVLMDIIQ